MLGHHGAFLGGCVPLCVGAGASAPKGKQRVGCLGAAHRPWPQDPEHGVRRQLPVQVRWNTCPALLHRLQTACHCHPALFTHESQMLTSLMCVGRNQLEFPQSDAVFDGLHSALLPCEGRSVGDQVAGDQGLHTELRKKTMDYVEVSPWPTWEGVQQVAARARVPHRRGSSYSHL